MKIKRSRFYIILIVFLCLLVFLGIYKTGFLKKVLLFVIFLIVFHNPLQFLHEVLHVRKLSVYRRKADIRDLVRLFQMFHNQFPDFPAGYFRFPFQAQLPLYLMGHILYGLCGITSQKSNWICQKIYGNSILMRVCIPV